jgi:hypothetical protein
MAKMIERIPSACHRIGVGKTKFVEDYILHDEADPYVPHTDGQVLRVRTVPLGEKAVGLFSDEIDDRIEALRRWRDRQPLPSRGRAARR